MVRGRKLTPSPSLSLGSTPLSLSLSHSLPHPRRTPWHINHPVSTAPAGYFSTCRPPVLRSIPYLSTHLRPFPFNRGVYVYITCKPAYCWWSLLCSLGVRDEPVKRGEVLPLRELLVQTPENLGRVGASTILRSDYHVGANKSDRPTHALEREMRLRTPIGRGWERKEMPSGKTTNSRSFPLLARITSR